ncbi:hypothetical protein [Cupriavidus sp. CuC1]|uniref:hypothetical protein n=1 Tax=Cupriavidus sp. CuC1 TaxID=3373131 RepID=UPI0037CD4D74
MTQGKADNIVQEWFESNDQRVVVLARPYGYLLETCLALTLQAKNLRNTIHFAVRNVLTAYEWDDSAGAWVVKSELHEAQQKAIDCFAGVVRTLNANREEKYRAAKEAGGEKVEKAKLTLIPELGPSSHQPARPGHQDLHCVTCSFCNFCINRNYRKRSGKSSAAA